MPYVILSEKLYNILIGELKRNRKLLVLTAIGGLFYWAYKKSDIVNDLRFDNERLKKENEQLRREKGDYIY